jgi:hypothetical protein
MFNIPPSKPCKMRSSVGLNRSCCDGHSAHYRQQFPYAPTILCRDKACLVRFLLHPSIHWRTWQHPATKRSSPPPFRRVLPLFPPHQLVAATATNPAVRHGRQPPAFPPTRKPDDDTDDKLLMFYLERITRNLELSFYWQLNKNRNKSPDSHSHRFRLTATDYRLKTYCLIRCRTRLSISRLKSSGFGSGLRSRKSQPAWETSFCSSLTESL